MNHQKTRHNKTIYIGGAVMNTDSTWIEILSDKTLWDKAFDRLVQKQFENKDEIISELEMFIETDEYMSVVKKIVNGQLTWSVPEKILLSKAGTTKKRVVYMYEPIERLVQGVLYRALTQYHIKELSPLCFSYKQGISTINAVKYIRKVKGTIQMYGLKMDISSYFNSVNKEHLIKSIEDSTEGLSGTRKTLQNLLLVDKATFRGKEIDEYKALIAGSPIASFYANYCLRELDNHFEKLQEEYEKKGDVLVYARYSDDILVMHHSEEEVARLTKVVSDFIEGYGLTINPTKYTHFSPDEPIDYLGLELSPEGIDIAKHSASKVKNTIKRWVKKARIRIEKGESTYQYESRNIVRRMNYKYFKSFIIDERKFGWGYYAFRFVTMTKTLTALDFYLKDQLRYLKTGKHNKHNWYAISEEEFSSMGYLSLYEMYGLFIKDFDEYYYRCALIK